MQGKTGGFFAFVRYLRGHSAFVSPLVWQCFLPMWSMTALWRRRCRKLSRFCPSDDALRFPSLFWHHLHCDHDLRHNRMLGFRGSRWSRHGHAHRVNRASNRNGMAAQRVPRQRAERQSRPNASPFGGPASSVATRRAGLPAADCATGLDPRAVHPPPPGHPTQAGRWQGIPMNKAATETAACPTVRRRQERQNVCPR